jgi:hypothetical protein
MTAAEVELVATTLRGVRPGFDDPCKLMQWRYTVRIFASALAGHLVSQSSIAFDYNRFFRLSGLEISKKELVDIELGDVRQRTPKFLHNGQKRSVKRRPRRDKEQS